MKYQKEIALIVVYLCHFYFSNSFAKYYSNLPLSTNIKIDNQTRHQFDVFIPMNQTYFIKLRVNRKNQPYWYLNKLLGNIERYNQQGMPLNIKWILSDKETTIKTNEHKSIDTCKWTSTYADKCLGQINVPPGHYQFSIVTDNQDNIFVTLDTQIIIGYDFTTAHAWQTEYILWSSLFNYFIAPIIALAFIAFQLTKYISLKLFTWHYRNKERKIAFKIAG